MAIMEALLINCKFYKNGCEEIMEYKEIVKHQVGCQFRGQPQIYKKDIISYQLALTIEYVFCTE